MYYNRRRSHVNLRTYRKKKLRSNTPIEIEPNTLYEFISNMICMDQSTRNYIKRYIDSYLLMIQANEQLPAKKDSQLIDWLFRITCLIMYVILFIALAVK